MKSYDNFFLPIDNMEAAKDFYGKTLGLKLKFDFPDIGMSAFSVGSHHIKRQAQVPGCKTRNLVCSR